MHLKIAQYLISELQCNPLAVNNDGWTPLHYVCDNGHSHIVQYLLSTGKVDPLAENEYGFTAVYFASISKNSHDLLTHLNNARRSFLFTLSPSSSWQDTVALVRQL